MAVENETNQWRNKCTDVFKVHIGQEVTQDGQSMTAVYTIVFQKIDQKNKKNAMVSTVCPRSSDPFYIVT